MLDTLPNSGHTHKRLTPKQLQKLKEGNKHADLIRLQRETEHSELEVPSAEALLDAHLQSYETKLATDTPMPLHTQTAPPRTWWQNLFAFFTK